MKKRLGLVLLGFLIAAPFIIEGAEYWDFYPDNSVPWQQGLAMASFNDDLYVSGTMGGTSKVWRTNDGSTWTEVYTSTDPVVHFVTQQTFLFGFKKTQFSVKTVDGTNWSSGPALTKELDYQDVMSFSGKLYTCTYVTGMGYSDMGKLKPFFPPTQQFDLQISTASATDGIWSNLLGLNGLKTGTFSFAVSSSSLFIGESPVSSVEPAMVWQVDPQTRTLTDKNISPTSVRLSQGTTYYKNFTYWAGTPVESLYIGSGGGASWNDRVVQAGRCYVPFVLNNELHAYGIDNNVMVMNNDNFKWYEVFNGDPAVYQSTRCPVYHEPAKLNGIPYLLPEKLMRLRQGLRNLVVENTLNPTLYFGQTDAVLKWTTEVNGTDYLTYLKVYRNGVGQDGDISHVYLGRYTSGSSVPETLEELGPAMPGVSWRTPNPYSLTVTDGMHLAILVDVSANPSKGATCRFSLGFDDTKWAVNSNFKTSGGLKADIPQKILTPDEAAAANAPIKDAIVMPTPAKDSVRFMYTLNSVSDVKITVYDRSGKDISEVEESDKPAAVHATTAWDASRVAPGIYFAVINITGSNGEKRVVKVKVVIEK